jgi:hypothetical protein
VPVCLSYEGSHWFKSEKATRSFVRHALLAFSAVGQRVATPLAPLQADLTNAVLEITALAVSLSDGGMAMSEALYRDSAVAALTMTCKGTIAAPPMAHQGHEPALVGPGMLKHTGIVTMCVG